MAKTVLLVGTRKGLFLLESDNRRTWTTRGPLCDGWPIYAAILDEDGTIYASAASEWHGAGVWRSTDLGETWEFSSEGIAYPDDSGLKVNKVSGIAATPGRLLVGAESIGLFESRDGAKTFSLVTTFDEASGREAWNDHANQPPGNLGLSAIIPDPADEQKIRVVVQGNSIFDTDDGGKTWTPKNRGLRREWPAPPDPEVGFCVHKLAPSPVDEQRWFQQNHVGTWRSDDGGDNWIEITEGLPSQFGFACAAHAHDRDTFFTTVLDPMHTRTMQNGECAVWRTRDAGSSWEKLTNGLPERDAHIGVLREGMVADRQDDFGLYFGTSTGQIFASTDDGESWSTVADFLPSISSVRVATLA
jgi:photosystem II stability/assembly factor-like uncharacterized protein